MLSEFCPRCQTIRAMNVTISKQKQKTEENLSQEVTIKSFHCHTCHSFVKSEELDSALVKA